MEDDKRSGKENGVNEEVEKAAYGRGSHGVDGCGSGTEHGGEFRGQKGVTKKANTSMETYVKSGSVITGVTKVKECNSSRETNFQETLRGIDSTISKFDLPVVGINTNGPEAILDRAEVPNSSNALGSVGCISREDEEMTLVGCPQGIEYTPCGWKRVVQDRVPAKAQIKPILLETKKKKKIVREVESKNAVVFSGEKLCAIDTTQKQMAETAGQPR